MQDINSMIKLINTYVPPFQFSFFNISFILCIPMYIYNTYIPFLLLR